jgi:hypothetical protein
MLSDRQSVRTLVCCLEGRQAPKDLAIRLE